MLDELEVEETNFQKCLMIYYPSDRLKGLITSRTGKGLGKTGIVMPI